MIPGATLIDYRDRCTTAEYFKKRIKKTVIPFLFWSISGIFFLIWRDGKENVSLKPTDIINSIINCKYLPLYFFYYYIRNIFSITYVWAYTKGETEKHFNILHFNFCNSQHGIAFFNLPVERKNQS